MTALIREDPGAALALASVVIAWPWTRVAVFRRTGLELLEQRLRETWLSIPFERGVVELFDASPTFSVHQALLGSVSNNESNSLV